MRIVVKVGTNIVTKPDHSLDAVFLNNLVTQLASLHREGHELVLVTSGAVAAGRNELALDREKSSIPFRQALAAIGQGILVRTYHDFFRKLQISVAQALLTNDDFARRENFLNIQGVFELLLKNRIIPIVNENDVTAIAELKFGDNDMLSAKTASLISADLLMLLTTVDYLYSDDPRKNPKAEKISFVQGMDDAIFSYASSKPEPGSLGGMESKLYAVKYAVEAGTPVFLGNGRRSNILRDFVLRFTKFKADERSIDEFPGTFFASGGERQQNYQKWLRMRAKNAARISVDDGAASALKEKGKSLLPSGIRAVEGDFARGDVVQISDLKGFVFAYGQVNYSASELLLIKGKKSTDIEKTLGYAFEEEVIHRDHMILS